MASYPTLQALLENDPQSRQLFDSLPQDVQVALQEQRQDTGSFEQLQQLSEGFRRRDAKR